MCVRAVGVFAVSIEHELQCFCSSQYVFAMVFTAQQVEDPSCSCCPSFLIAFYSDAPGGKMSQALTIIMLVTLLKGTTACIKLIITCSVS